MTKKEIKELQQWHNDLVESRKKEVEQGLKEFVEMVKQQRENRSWLHKFMDWLTGWDKMY